MSKILVRHPAVKIERPTSYLVRNIADCQAKNDTNKHGRKEDEPVHEANRVTVLPDTSANLAS